MRLYLINPSNPLVSIAKPEENRWHGYTTWKPLGLLIVAALTPPEWDITVIDENLIGGAVIRAGDVVIDGSLRARLNGLANALTK